jgi:hypothetical protein
MDTGILDMELISLLLRDYTVNLDEILRLLVKFGLIVHLQSPGSSIQEFLVPSLIPPLPMSPLGPHSPKWTDLPYSTCYLVFTAFPDLEKSTTLLRSDIVNMGFLPSGLFERLIGKAVTWSQQTCEDLSLHNLLLGSDCAVMFYGAKRFRLKLDMECNSIELNIEGENPIPIHDRIVDQISTITSECLNALHCFTVIRVLGGLEQESEGRDPSDMFISLGRLRAIADTHSVLNMPGGRSLLTESEVKANYQEWLPSTNLISQYDIFLSYRWGQIDSSFTVALFDRFTLYTIDDELASTTRRRREVILFLDSKRLKDGTAFQDVFGRAMKDSLVVIPIVSCDALIRLQNSRHNPLVVDNVLVEVYFSSPSAIYIICLFAASYIPRYVFRAVNPFKVHLLIFLPL